MRRAYDHAPPMSVGPPAPPSRCRAFGRLARVVNFRDGYQRGRGTPSNESAVLGHSDAAETHRGAPPAV